MRAGEYRRALVAARRELVDLLKQRQKLDQRISQLQPTVAHLEALCNELNRKMVSESVARQDLALGLTAAVRKTLEQGAPLPLTPIEVKEQMEAQGFDFSTYSNPLAAIHTVLKRLVAAYKVKVKIGPKNKKTYQWITPVDMALALLEKFTKPAVGKGTK